MAPSAYSRDKPVPIGNSADEVRRSDKDGNEARGRWSSFPRGEIWLLGLAVYSGYRACPSSHSDPMFAHAGSNPVPVVFFFLKKKISVCFTQWRAFFLSLIVEYLLFCCSSPFDV